MPVQPSYPGVYVEELPSSNNVIVGVSTSITAFLGRAAKGLAQTPVLIQSFGDFEAIFGGLNRDYPLSYVVQDFFLNGGFQAIIVRLYNGVDRGGITNSIDWQTAQKQGAESSLAVITGAKVTAASDLPALLQTQLETYEAANPPQAAQLVVAKAINDDLTAAIQAGSSLATIVAEFKDKAKTPEIYYTPFPKLETATLNIDSQAWRDAVDAAQMLPLIAFDSLFDSYGNPLANPASSGAAIKSIAQSESRYIASSGTALEAQAARDMLNNLGPFDSMTVVNALDTLFAQVAKITAIPDANSKKLVGDLQAAILSEMNKLFSGNNFVDKSKIGKPTDLQTALAKALGGVKNPDKNSSNATPGANIEIDTSSIQSVFVSAFMGVGRAAALLDSDLQLQLQAMDPGAWGSYLSATVNIDGITAAVAKQYEQYGLSKGDLFNLVVTYAPPNGTQTTENIGLVTVKRPVSDSDPNYILPPNRLDIVLENTSNLVRAALGSYTEDEAWKLFPVVPPPTGSVGKASAAQDSQPLTAEDYLGDPLQSTGIYALDQADIFNLLCLPPDIIYPKSAWETMDELVLQTAAIYCMNRRAFLIIDPPNSSSLNWYNQINNGLIGEINPMDLGIAGDPARFAAVYFPLVQAEDPLFHNQVRTFPICGIIAGQMAASDLQVGVWKAPAGMDAALQGIKNLQYNMSDNQNGVLNVQGINCLRYFNPGGNVVWGARTLRGQDALSDDYKYVPVRRLVNYMELSLQRGTKWAVFQPNDEQLWSALRVSIGSFLKGLQTQGALLSYTVKCDASTTTYADMLQGIVNVYIGFTPVEPAEYIVLQFQIIGLNAS